MRVSVIIPVLNGQEFLAQTLRSVLNQTVRPDEVIVVDNGSADASVEIARGFGGIVRVESCAKAGACAARNLGAAQAMGDALMFLDADDLLGPTVLEELVAALQTRPEAIACCAWMRFELEDGCWLARPASCPPKRWDQDDLGAWLTGWYHPPCSVLWSRRAYEAAGGWDEQIASNQDGDLMMRALAAGTPLVRAPRGTAYYRRLPEGAVSLSGRRFTHKGLQSRLEVIDRIAAILRETGRAGTYAPYLAEAYASIGKDCDSDAAELAARAEESARVFGGLGPVRRARRRLGHALARRMSRHTGTARRGASSGRAHAAIPDTTRQDEADAPLVSVIIPTYNRERLLERAIRSVLTQSYRTFEVIVVDDGSTDGTADMVAQSDDPRLRLLVQDRNMGVAAARNRGMRHAKGRFIAFLDSDDEWAAEKLRLQVELMQRRPDRVGLVYTGLTLRGSDDPPPVWIPSARGDVFADMLHRNVVHYGTSSTLIRREVIETVGFFDEKLPANEDHDYWTRIARFYEFDFVPEPLMNYNHEVSDAQPQERRSRRFNANMAARRIFLQRYGDAARDAGVRHLFCLDIARRHLRSPEGNIGEARRMLAKAIRDRPGQPVLYIRLVFSLFPQGARHRLGPFLGSLRRNPLGRPRAGYEKA